MAVFAGLVFLWLLATLAVNLRLEGDRRKGLTGLFRILLLLTVLGLGTAIRLGAVSLGDPLPLVFAAQVTLCGYFLVSEFTLYWKRRDGASAKRAVWAAAATQAGMLLLLGIALLYGPL